MHEHRRDQAANARDDNPRDGDRPQERVCARHQEEVPRGPDDDRKEGEETERRGDVEDVDRIAVVRQHAVPEAVPVGELVRELVVPGGPVDPRDDEQERSRPEVNQDRRTDAFQRHRQSAQPGQRRPAWVLQRGCGRFGA